MDFMIELIRRIKFWIQADRLGPDIPLTHWKLFFPKKARKLCVKMFKKFDDGAEFRPGSYAINCTKISIGKRVVIRPNTMLFGSSNITIEDGVLIGSGVHIYTANHNFENPNIPIIDQLHSPGKDVLLKKGCWIGANVTILPGITIGINSVVGAGSIVTKDIPSYTVAVGNPACVIKKILPVILEET